MRVRVLMFSDVSQCSLSSCSLSVVFSGTKMYRIGNGAQIRDPWGYLSGSSGWGYVKPLQVTDFPDGTTHIRLVSVVFARTDVCTPAMLILSDRKNPKTKYEYCHGTTNVSLGINNLRVSMHGDPLTNNLAFILRFVGVSWKMFTVVPVPFP